MSMESEIKYAMGYYDAVVTHILEEKELPTDIESTKALLIKITDASDMLSDCIFNIGLDVVANRISKGGE